MTKRMAIAAAVLCLAGAACRAASPEGATIRVVATLPPLAYLVEQLGDDHVTVDGLLRPGDNPHTYEPTPQQVQTLASADMFVTAAGLFEQRLVRQVAAQRPSLRVVDVAAGIAPLTEADHGDEAGHDAAADPHVWLSPPALKSIAETISKALVAADPNHAEAYAARLRAVEARVDELDAAIRAKLAPYKGQAFLVYHGAFGYFARAYGLRQVAVEAEGKAPSPRQIQKLIQEARTDQIGTIFIEPQFDPAAAEVLARALNAKVVQLDPMNPDVFANLQAIADALAAGFANE